MPNTGVKKQRKASRKAARAARRERALTSQPPPRQLVVTISRVFRFVTTNAQSGYNIEVQDILGLIGVATSATGVTSLFTAGRIRYVEMWAPASSGAQVNPDITWLGANYPEPSRFNNAVMGSATPSHIKSYPPKDGNADAGNWFVAASSTLQLVRLVVPAASVVDISVDLKMQNATALNLGNPLTYTSSGLTAGYVYFGYLDKSSGAAKLIPADVTAYG